MHRPMRIKLAGIPLIVGFVLVFTTGIGMAAPQRGGQVISPDLAAEINRLSPGGKVSIIVSLKDQVHPDQIKGIDKEDKRRNLLKELRSKSDLTQGGIRSFLKTNGLSGKVSKFTPLWINNAVAVTADSDVINNLATFPEVASITTDAVITGPQVSPSAPVTGVPAPNLSVINAPGMWNLGYQGQGVVIASMDTGVDYTHPDLSAAYRGGSNSWFDPYSQHAIPTDLNGHGTWTLGVMVGGGSSGTILGVAPQAKWIAVKIFDDTNMATTTGIHLGFQWLLDPDNNPLTNDAPNVVNDSWDLGYPGCNLTFEPDIHLSGRGCPRRGHHHHRFARPV
jgi:serine protease AprX